MSTPQQAEPSAASEVHHDETMGALKILLQKLNPKSIADQQKLAEADRHMKSAQATVQTWRKAKRKASRAVAKTTKCMKNVTNVTMAQMLIRRLSAEAICVPSSSESSCPQSERPQAFPGNEMAPLVNCEAVRNTVAHIQAPGPAASLSAEVVADAEDAADEGMTSDGERSHTATIP